MNAAELDSLLRTVWLFVTPVSLVLAAIILTVRFTTQRRWNNRMSRATVLLIVSYAVLMVRTLARVLNWGVLGGSAINESAPDPFYAAFYTIAALYFFYALVRDWVIPSIFWSYRWLRGRRDEERPGDMEHA